MTNVGDLWVTITHGWTNHLTCVLDVVAALCQNAEVAELEEL